jgi:opacity protein-like surface antigen
MSRRLLIAAATCCLCALATPAFADLTLFLGVTPTPERRTVKGIALGTGLLVVGFEFEYASTNEDETNGSPSLKTGMGNLLVQTPIPVAGFQFYGTIGGGLYREELHGTTQFADHRVTSFGSNIGAGTKVTLTGPLRLRFDYRLFNLRGDPLYSRVHRVYAGVNLAF